MNIGTALSKIRSCGFEIYAEGDRIAVEPFDKLTVGQMGWLKANKPAILDHLLIDDQGGNDIGPANDPGQIMAQVWTPAGDPVRVKARDQEHANFLKAMNPGPGMVRCCDCTHADIHAGIAACRAGAESGLPIRGRWYTDRHPCESSKANA